MAERVGGITDAGKDESFKSAVNAIVPTPRSRQQTSDTLLERILMHTEGDSALLTKAEHLTDFVPRLRSKLYEQAATLGPSQFRLGLICKALQEDEVADLAPFKALTPEDLSVVISNLAERTRTLNLSNLPDLTDSGLKIAFGIDRDPRKSYNVEPVPFLSKKSARSGDRSSSTIDASSVISRPTSNLPKGLKAIILLNCPKVSLKFIATHLGSYEICHSELLLRPFTNDAEPLEFLAPNAISQVVWIGVPAEHLENRSRRRIDWTSLDSTPGHRNNTRNPSYEGASLSDIPLPTGKMVHGLYILLRWVLSRQSTLCAGWRQSVARCFATASSLDLDSKHAVGPLGYEAWTEKYGRSEPERGRPKKLRPHQWAILVIEEGFDILRSKPQISYAIVKPRQDCKQGRESFKVVSVPDYLAEVKRSSPTMNDNEIRSLEKWWRSRAESDNGEIMFYREKHFKEALEKIFYKNFL